MRIRYFAWMREHTGCSEEQLALPAAVQTVSDLIGHLSSVSDGHALALKNRKTVRVAVNLTFAASDTPLCDTDEVAFFPPVTGG